MSDSPQQVAAAFKAAEAFDKTRTASAITIAKRAIGIIIIGIVGFWMWWTVGNTEASATAYRLTNVWIAEMYYHELIPMARNAMDDGVLRKTEWWKIAARQEEIEQTRQREELLKTVIQGLP